MVALARIQKGTGMSNELSTVISQMIDERNKQRDDLRLLLLSRVRAKLQEDAAEAIIWAGLKDVYPNNEIQQIVDSFNTSGTPVEKRERTAKTVVELHRIVRGKPEPAFGSSIFDDELKTPTKPVVLKRTSWFRRKLQNLYGWLLGQL